MDKVVLDLSAMVAISLDGSERSLRRLLAWQVELCGVKSELEYMHDALTEFGWDHAAIVDEIKKWSHRIKFTEPLAPGTVLSQDVATDAAPALAAELEAIGLVSADSDRLAIPSFTDPNGKTIGIFPPPLTGDEDYPWSRASETETIVLDLSSILKIYELPDINNLLHYSSLNPHFDLVIATSDLEAAGKALLAKGEDKARVEGFITALESASTLMEDPKERAYFDDAGRDKAVAIAYAMHADVLLTEDTDLLSMKNWEDIDFYAPLTERDSQWVDDKVVVLPSWFDLLTQARDAADETVVIYNAPDEMLGNLAGEILEQNGIDAIVVAEQTNMFMGVPQDPGGHWGVVRVLSHDAWRARELLDEHMPQPQTE
jgi:predicted nucleic acid-binding protein